MSELIYVAIISGTFTLLCILMLHLSWKSKLIMTLQAEELKSKAEIKIAKLKSVKQPKRLPKGYRTQLTDLLNLLGDERVQDILGVLQEREEDIPEGNKIINSLLPLAQAFLGGMGEAQAEQAEKPKMIYEA